MTQLPNQNMQFMDDFIDRSIKNSIGTQNSSFYKVLDDDYIIEDYNVFRDRYFAQIINMTEKYNMTDVEFAKYRYRPKRLSMDLYQSIDYWYIILMVNRMNSIMEFKKRSIRIPTTACINFCKNTMKKEENNILKNKAKIREKIS